MFPKPLTIFYASKIRVVNTSESKFRNNKVSSPHPWLMYASVQTLCSPEIPAVNMNLRPTW